LTDIVSHMLIVLAMAAIAFSNCPKVAKAFHVNFAAVLRGTPVQTAIRNSAIIATMAAQIVGPAVI
jgi:hypothetical protein